MTITAQKDFSKIKQAQQRQYRAKKITNALLNSNAFYSIFDKIMTHCQFSLCFIKIFMYKLHLSPPVKYVGRPYKAS